MAANVAKSLVDVPDFLRLGLMLTLNQATVGMLTTYAFAGADGLGIPFFREGSGQ